MSSSNELCLCYEPVMLSSDNECQLNSITRPDAVVL